MTLPVEVEDLVKTFGRTRALDGLDLAVRAGEVHGFLGPNGAGKSTTLRVLLGMLARTPARCDCWGVTRGATLRPCTVAWPTSRAT